MAAGLDDVAERATERARALTERLLAQSRAAGDAARPDQIPPVASDDVRGGHALSFVCCSLEPRCVHAVISARLRTRSPAAPVTCPCLFVPLARVVLDDVLLADGRLVHFVADREALEGVQESL